MTPESEPPARRKKSNATSRETDKPELNGIERGRSPRAEPEEASPKKRPDAAARAAERQAGAGGLPNEIRERFIGVDRQYYFPDGKAAFTDHGTKLSTRSENIEVIRSLIAIAQAREWSEIKVTGTERFRKEAWFAARISGIEVRGYTPTEFEQERLVRAIARREASPEANRSDPQARGEATRRQTPSTNAERAAAAPEESEPINGRLVDHGRATYRHDPKEPMSYYVRIETDRGDREIWGVDLERAFRESLSRPTLGDEVTARSYGRDPMTVKTEEGELATHRNRWIVERNDFLAERAAAARVFLDAAVKAADGVKRHPELQGSYLLLQAAKLGAERDIRDPEDQNRFVARARISIADAIERGEPLEPVRLRVRPARTPEQKQSRNPEQTPTR